MSTSRRFASTATGMCAAATRRMCAAATRRSATAIRRASTGTARMAGVRATVRVTRVRATAGMTSVRIAVRRGAAAHTNLRVTAATVAQLQVRSVRAADRMTAGARRSRGCIMVRCRDGPVVRCGER